MRLFGLLKRPSNPPTDAAEITAFYKRLRPLRLRLNNELVGRLSRDVLEEGGNRLGILRRGMFVFDNEDESAVLMDYCIYNVCRRGRNAIDEYLRDCPPDADSDEMACLQAMRRAKYALIVVTGIEPGVGCHIKNLFTDEARLLVDVGFSRTAQPGVLLATRLLDYGAFVTTTGAALPMGILKDNELDAWQRKLSTGVYDEDEDPAPLIRRCLERGASSHVRYEESIASGSSDNREAFASAGMSAQQRRTLAKRSSSKPAGNRRCHCGSGKMFKNCCGKHRRERQEGR